MPSDIRGTVERMACVFQVQAELLDASLLRHVLATCGGSFASAAQLHFLVGPAGPATPPRQSPQGAACWLHVHCGTLRVHAWPGSDANVAVLRNVQPASTQRRMLTEGVAFACAAGQALMLPAGWIVSKELLEPCVATCATPSAA